MTPKDEIRMVENFREHVEVLYNHTALGSGSRGGCFGSILCDEIHHEGLHFKALAEKWHITVPFLGEVIADHCKRL